MAKLGDVKKQDKPGENAHLAPSKRPTESEKPNPAALDPHAQKTVLKPQDPAAHVEKGRPKSTGRWGA